MPDSRRPTPPQPPQGVPTDKQLCLYIAEACTELRRLARRPRFRTISYLLDLARLEAERTGKELPDDTTPPPPKPERH